MDRCRAIGINVPIIPGIKPITNINQLSILPKVFKVDIPTEFASSLLACTTDEDRKAAGIEWGIKQVNELYEGGGAFNTLLLAQRHRLRTRDCQKHIALNRHEIQRYTGT